MPHDTTLRFLLEDQVSRALKAIDDNMGDFQKNLKSLSDVALKGSAAIAGIGLTMKQAFELGEQGAAVIQTAESFDLLLGKIGATPDLLNELQIASKGTIDDMQLMGSTSLLLAGTQGQLATELANSTPQLLEIAKAANKLNPSLGDTTFLYDSLARGIKRASPLILDNLGLVVSLGEANEKYATSIGKTVEELTEEEKKIALLNSVLEQGDVMINQVGGSTDAQTDAFQRLDASTKNLTDRLKAQLVPYLADAAEGLELLLTMSDRLNKAYAEHENNVRSTAQTYDDYLEEMRRAFDVQHMVIEETENGIEVYKRHSSGLSRVTDDYNILSRYQWEVTQSTQEAQEAVGDLNEAQKWQTGTLAEVTSMTEEHAEALRETIELEKEQEEALVASSIAAEALAGALDGKLQDSYERYLTSVSDLRTEQGELQDQLASLQSGEVPGLSEQIRENEQAIRDLIDANQTYVSAADEMIAAGNYSSDELEFLQEQSQRTAEEIQNLEEANRNLAIEAQTAASEGIAELTRELEKNEEAQTKALEAMKEATSEMIFTKASKGLDTEATIALARAMGVLSEEDYTVIASIEELRKQHDLNKDGMIDASEGAFEYAAKINQLNEAVISLKEQEMPVTFENMASAMDIARGSAGDLETQIDSLYGALTELHALPGVTTTSAPTGAPSGYDYPTGPTGIYSAAGTYGGAGVSVGVALNYYNYGLSLADEYELEQILRPVVQRIVGGQ